MRVVQVANFYGPRSGRTPHRSGPAGRGALRQRTRGIFLIVPGARTERHSYARGVVGVPCRQAFHSTGGYRARLCQEPCGLLGNTATRRPGGSPTGSPWSLGRWGREHGVTTVMISERLDRFAGAPASAQKFANFANARTAANYDTVVCTTGFAREDSTASERQIPSPSHWA